MRLELALATCALLTLGYLWAPFADAEQDTPARSLQRAEQGRGAPRSTPAAPEGAGPEGRSKRSPPHRPAQKAAHRTMTGQMRFVPAFALEVETRDILSGVRIERGVSGTLVAQERLDGGGEAVGIPLPARLGGGFLFFQPTAASGAPSTALYRAESWTGDLAPLALLPFVVENVRAGFDRLYVFGTGIHVALDARTGGVLPLSPLPPLVTLQELSFGPHGQAEVQGPLVGKLATTDAGLSWNPVADRERADEESAEPTPMSESSTSLSSGAPGNPSRLRDVILRGVPGAEGELLALLDGHLVRLDAATLRLQEVAAPPLKSDVVCQGLFDAPEPRPVTEVPAGDQRAGTEAPPRLFLCQGRATEVFAVPVGIAPPALRLLASFRRPRRALAAAASGVLLEGACEDAPSSPERRGCWVGPRGHKSVELGSASAHEVFALRDELAFRLDLTPKRGVRVRRLGTTQPEAYFSIPDEADLRSLVQEGTWLPGASRVGAGMAFWTTLGDRFAGVLVDMDESSLEVGPIQKPLRRAFFSGARALTWGAAGFARLSTDGGATFREVNFPYRSGDPDPNIVVSSEQDVVLGCGPAGCSVGAWLSLGWEPPRAENVAALPARTPIPPPGGGRFRFDCVATGRRSGPSLEKETTEQDSEALAPFWETPPPRLLGSEEGISVGDNAKVLRLFAWGPRDASWGSRGSTQIHFRDRYQFGPLLRSAVSPGLFGDGVRAREFLGLLDPTTQLVFGEVSSSGRAGVAFVRTRQATSLLAFTEGGHIRAFPGLEELQVRSLAGVVERQGGWAVGNLAGRTFRVLELSRDGARVLSDFEVGDTGGRDIALVSSTSGDLGLAMTGDAGLFVYPLSEQGELGAPIVVPHQGSRPEQCAPEAVGFVVERELSIAPYVESRGHNLDIDRLRLRMIVGYGPPCVDAAAGETRGPLDGLREQPGARGLPLIVSDLARGGRRLELVCE